MKKLLLIPEMLLPYAFALGLLISNLFENEDQAALVFGIVIAIFSVAPLICNVIYVITTRKDDPHSLLFGALVVKLVHIPAFVIIFIFGLISSLMIFMTFALILMLIVFDYLLLLSSSFISVFALAKNAKSSKTLSVLALICQFIFCADVISLIIVWIVSKNQRQAEPALSPFTNTEANSAEVQ